MDKLERMLARMEKLLLFNAKDVFTCEEAALFLGVSEDRVRHLASAHKITYFKQEDCNKLYFRKADLERTMTARCFPSDADFQRDHELSMAKLIKTR